MERNESRHGGYKAELVVSTLAIIKRVCLGICQVSRIVVPIAFLKPSVLSHKC